MSYIITFLQNESIFFMHDLQVQGMAFDYGFLVSIFGKNLLPQKTEMCPQMICRIRNLNYGMAITT